MRGRNGSLNLNHTVQDSRALKQDRASPGQDQRSEVCYLSKCKRCGLADRQQRTDRAYSLAEPSAVPQILFGSWQILFNSYWNLPAISPLLEIIYLGQDTPREIQRAKIRQEKSIYSASKGDCILVKVFRRDLSWSKVRNFASPRCTRAFLSSKTSRCQSGEGVSSWQSRDSINGSVG